MYLPFSLLLLLLPAILAGTANASYDDYGLTPTYYYPQATSATAASKETTLPYLKNSSHPYLGQAPATRSFPSKPCPTGDRCIVKPLGFGQDDSAQILEAVEKCGKYGVITLPAPYVYTIKRRMYMKLEHARLEVFGTLSFEPDLVYWIDNSFRIEFQNMSTAWIVEGHHYEITGGGWEKGGINGNGQAWMTHAAGHSNLFGRPISLSIYNSTDVIVTDFSIRQPQFWSFWIQDSYNLELSNIYINGTNTDPYGNGTNYETNIDGLDSLRVDTALIKNWTFHGGDDCLAPKGNSTNLVISNMTCIGGGIAFGSVGQYQEAPDYMTNITATNISVSQDIRPRTGGASVSGGAYFKSWVGHAEGTPPQGGGGGTGKVSNVSFENLSTFNTSQAVYINKCYFKVPDQANYCDTSTLQFADLHFRNVTGTVNGQVGIALNCSAAAPCHDISLENVNLQNQVTKVAANLTCVNAGTVTGAACNSSLPIQN